MLQIIMLVVNFCYYMIDYYAEEDLYVDQEGKCTR